ncbi:hypothetical protein LTS08_003397 [Lithohypha guttulata]|nr:hypothetical protein LTS08_003397 [Lithohypha guttulata]
MDAGLEEEIALEVESVSYMSAAALNAEGYSHEDSRVFLAGDAAYVMPPTGGIGGNTGIQKLAYVLKGQAGPSFMETYNQERQPVVDRSVQQAYSRLVNKTFKDKSVPHEQELPDDTCELGYRYISGALIQPDVEGIFEQF